MKNKFLLFFLALSMVVMAGERSAQDAAAVAAQFMNQQVLAPARKASVNASSYKLAHTRQKLNSETPAFYVFNTTGAGFVVVSADDRTEDVLMYSEEGTLDVENANPNLKFWLNRLQEEISVANDENTFTAAEKKARKATMVTAISPLLVNQDGTEITWDQTAPYWNQCPMSLFYPSERCLTGCVATAAAQIMYKWRYPAKGTGSKTYTSEECAAYDETTWECTNSKTQQVSKNFSTVTFDWDNMLPAYYGVSSTTAQQNAVATLMSCCGVAAEMDYGGETIGGSGAYTDVMGVGLTTYFGYKAEKFIQMKNYEYSFEPTESNLTAAQFATYFNADLEAGRPIIMGGTDTNNGGHEFVCDGRDANGKFHINWGWEGSGNCYCSLTALKPNVSSSYNFSSSLDAMIGLEPKDRKIDTVHVTGVTVAPTTLTLKQQESSTLTATIAPSNATIQGVTWSSSNNAVATVSAAGVVKGVAQGSVTITATTKDGNKTATCAVTVTDEVLEVTDCDNYSYTFTSKCSTGSNTLGKYTWNIVLNAGDIQNVDATKGQQFGSKNNPCGQVSLTTSNPAECQINSAKVNASMGSSGDAQLAVYIGGTQIGSTQTLTTTATEYTFSNSASVQGNLEIRLTNSAKAMYIKSIEVNPEDGSEVAVTGVELDKTILTIKKGESATLVATVKPTNATNKDVTWFTSDSKVATVTNGVVTAVAGGKANITVTTKDGNKTATCAVTVITDTVIVRDTVYIRDTIEVHDTTIVPIEVHDTIIVQVHDTTIMPIEVHDTTIVQVHDTTYLNMIEVNSMNPTMGTAILQVYAIPEEGYQFLSWSDYNTDNPRTVVKSDSPQTFTAVFTSAQPTSVRAQQEDEQGQVIKRIINGRLYIERHGVIYDATGNELK